MENLKKWAVDGETLIESKDTYFDYLQDTISCKFEPLNDFLNMMTPHDEREVCEVANICLSIFENALHEINRKVTFITSELGAIQVLCASYRNDKNVPGGMMLGVDLNPNFKDKAKKELKGYRP